MEILTDRDIIDIGTGMLAHINGSGIEAARQRLSDDAARAQVPEAQLALAIIVDHVVRISSS